MDRPVGEYLSVHRALRQNDEQQDVTRRKQHFNVSVDLRPPFKKQYLPKSQSSFRIVVEIYVGCLRRFVRLPHGMKVVLMRNVLESEIGNSINFVLTFRRRKNGRHLTDDTLKRIFLNESDIISIKISLTFVPKGPINDIPALVQIMAWCRPGDKPLSESMMVSLLTHICVTRSQRVNHQFSSKLCTWRIT